MEGLHGAGCSSKRSDQEYVPKDTSQVTQKNVTEEETCQKKHAGEDL